MVRPLVLLVAIALGCAGPLHAQEVKLLPINAGVGDQFGSAVALSGDRALIGAPETKV